MKTWYSLMYAISGLVIIANVWFHFLTTDQLITLSFIGISNMLFYIEGVRK